MKIIEYSCKKHVEHTTRLSYIWQNNTFYYIYDEGVCEKDDGGLFVNMILDHIRSKVITYHSKFYDLCDENESFIHQKDSLDRFRKCVFDQEGEHRKSLVNEIYSHLKKILVVFERKIIELKEDYECEDADLPMEDMSE